MTQALISGAPVRRRALMGLLDADGWTWASVKASVWFVILIFMLAYIPDRAYYFTVNRTLEVGLLAWSPVNFCPAENKTLPCPAPVGAVVPWEPSSPELGLPGPRTHAAVVQFGSRLLVVGGSDGSAATTTTYIAELKKGALQPWSEGPALPEARSGASLVIVGSAAYLIGGTDADGKPTDTVWMLPVHVDTAELGRWTEVDGLSLPEARTGASGLAVADGFVLLGGRGPDGAPASTVWKSTADSKGSLGQFEAQAPLLVPVADASVAQIGDFVWLFGGSGTAGPVGAVQRGTLEARPSLESPKPNPVPPPLEVLQWAVSDAANLPGARSAFAGFTANGALYVVGGTDGSAIRNEMYWTVPDADGSVPGWKHLDQTDLPAEGLEGASAVVVGSNVIIIGGTMRDGVLSSAVRANLAPQEPFFQAGLVGAVVPALRIEGEIGQQLGYLSAAGAGTVNGVILILIGWAYAHPKSVRAFIDRRRGRRPDRGA